MNNYINHMNNYINQVSNNINLEIMGRCRNLKNLEGNVREYENMTKIITISREFGSGGRELGKRLAERIGCEYYDKEIIMAIAENKGMNEVYVEHMLESQPWKEMPLHFRSSLSGSRGLEHARMDLLLEQKKVIEAIAGRGKDCIIVGRNADVLLNDFMPFKLFVCADMNAKIGRCLERAGENEKVSRKELERKIRSVDKGRAQIRNVVTDSPWGDRYAYHLTVNTSGWNIKELIPMVAEYAAAWFRRRENDTVV